MDKNHLSSKIYHDIRNYVLGVSGAAKMILDSKTDGEIEENEDLRLIKSILEQSDQMSSLIEELLDSNEQRNSNFTLKNIQKYNINELIDDAILNNQYFASNNHVKIIADLADNLPDLECDKARMNQILINAINNAVKYSFENSEVNISSKLINGKICVHISDSGVGMNDEEINIALSGNGSSIDKSSLNKNIKSYGIGLPIVKDLVELHKGQLEIESIKGIGTSLKLWFNVGINNASNTNKLILLVEDNQVNATVISHILKKEGYKIYHAENGQIALQILEEYPNINLIITDGQMPIMNGYETAKAIREGKSFKNFTNFNIPIIALMAIEDRVSISRAKECQINHFISKDLSKTQLLSTIKNYLQ